MFAVLHSDINSLKSGLLHLTGQPYCKKCRSKMELLTIALGAILLIDTPVANVIKLFTAVIHDFS